MSSENTLDLTLSGPVQVNGQPPDHTHLSRILCLSKDSNLGGKIAGVSPKAWIPNTACGVPRASTASPELRGQSGRPFKTLASGKHALCPYSQKLTRSNYNQCMKKGSQNGAQGNIAKVLQSRPTTNILGPFVFKVHWALENQDRVEVWTAHANDG
ncbi:MAG: hypothetical protein L6R41_002394 [Letrouitia leprolyta]|nr:MAG: hypothetical protein L6R41_002394 [Letrouitia leprolyta]